MSAAELAALIVERQPCVVLTGAGVSTESGIPDFRSESGIWAEIDPLEVASLRAFRRDPARVWGFYQERIGLLRDAEPNAAHSALAELESRGLVEAVVTQNIDLLHTRAGSKDVVELHGSIRSAQCLGCLWTEPADAVLAQLAESAVPACPKCGEVLKPGVVLFGELLPAGPMSVRLTSRAGRGSCSSSARRSRSGQRPAFPSRRRRSRPSTAGRLRSTRKHS